MAAVNDTSLPSFPGIGLKPQETLGMKRFVASVVLAITLLTSGAVVSQAGLIGTAYANDGGGE